MIQPRTLIIACMIMGLLLTTGAVVGVGQWRLYHAVEAWRAQQADADAQLIQLKQREICVLWMTGEQRARVRGGGQEDGRLPTWNELCAWMEGITP